MSVSGGDDEAGVELSGEGDAAGIITGRGAGVV
jgi:hypothetical protein